MIHTSDLRHALERIFGEPLTGFDRRASLYSSTFAIEELEIELDGSRRLNLIFKDLSRDAMLDRARAVKPAWLYDPYREIGVYRSILPAIGSAPLLYGAVMEEVHNRHWLFLEKVPGVELYQMGSFETWIEAARWLGALHAAPHSQPAAARALVPQLLEHDRAFYESWLARARAFAGPAVDSIVETCRSAVDVLLSLPRTLIHGEFYASNILVEPDGTGVRIRPVDWEMAGIGPGILDVAALAAGNWSRDQRLRMVEAYCVALPESLRPPDPIQAFDCARIEIALQWLGWAEHWLPYRYHSYDWLAEAMNAARHLRGEVAVRGAGR